MSDPVTNVEIEDVLASIRRLVSDESRTPAAAPKTVDKLVLTPALRVAEPEATAPMPAAPTAVDTLPDSAPDTAAAPTSGDEVEGGSAGAMQLGAEYYLPDSEDHTDDELTSADGDQVAAAAVGSDTPSPIESRIAEMEALVANQPGQWDPEGDEEDAYARSSSMDWVDHTPRESLGVWDGLEAIEVPEGADDSPVQAATDEAVESGFDTSEDANQGDSDDDAALEVSVQDLTGQDDLDVEGAAIDAYEDGEEAAAVISAAAAGDEAQDWQEDLDAGYGTGETVTLPPYAAQDLEYADAAAEEEDFDTLDLSEAGIDEEALRELVAEIVRQELQGTLGERITRNVRKLVRREIQRALTAQNLQ